MANVARHNRASASPAGGRTVVFCLTSARSGTKFVSHILQQNLTSVVSRHEPQPDMFGRCIYWRHLGEFYKIRRAFWFKKQRIDRCRGEVYIETSHAFLKSFAEVALEAYPQMKLLHIVRDPVKVARSEVNRWSYGDRYRIPFRYYRAHDGERLFRFTLTGREAIFQDCALPQITTFQFHLLQWIEIENRAMRFLDRYDKHEDCFTVDSPRDYKDPARVAALLDFVGGTRMSRDVITEGRQNTNPCPTIISEQDRAEYAAVLEAVPRTYLDIFHKAPYKRFDWADCLRNPGQAYPPQETTPLAS